jgi:hypothetical protein
MAAELLPCQAPKHEQAKDDEEYVWKPDEQLGMHPRIPAERITDDDKEKIGNRNN